ncbi:hypothetical protein HO173_000122 [Letharia columbiana]|uniref:Uncharacterized protein n=1 Tax=Letharia columbiana TaxID=112416 RepID=A0A8H6G6E5_9LECA|nr:uncharacterized protein HO173_000122 [Letharia columbiana]KAF6241412.1 hypothetical protein HO173_000122 [Letharia columbiana]
MSFGFGVGDFLAASNIAKGVYEACKDGPEEYQRNIERDPHSLLNKKGVKRKPELVGIIRNCRTTMQEL